MDKLAGKAKDAVESVKDKVQDAVGDGADRPASIGRRIAPRCRRGRCGGRFASASPGYRVRVEWKMSSRHDDSTRVRTAVVNVRQGHQRAVRLTGQVHPAAHDSEVAADLDPLDRVLDPVVAIPTVLIFSSHESRVSISPVVITYRRAGSHIERSASTSPSTMARYRSASAERMAWVGVTGAGLLVPW